MRRTPRVLEKADQDISKLKIARLSISSNTFLVILKLIVGFAIGSVSIISEAIHSSMDLLAASIAFLAVRISAEPPDDRHTFGHGKYEDISGLVEAVLIFIAALLIIYEAIRRIFSTEVSLEMNILIAGIAVMFLSTILNWYVSSKLLKVAKQTESIALESDAWHLRTDVYTSLGIFAGLVVIRITGLTILDPVFAMVVAGIIMKAAYDLSKRSFSDLIDQKLPDSEVNRIKQIICEHYSGYAEFHELRTRRSGPERFIDFHVLIPRDLTIEEAHDLADHLEADLILEFPRSNITIHLEPCTENCSSCEALCNIKVKR